MHSHGTLEGIYWSLMAACVNYNYKFVPAVLKPGTQALEHSREEGHRFNSPLHKCWDCSLCGFLPPNRLGWSTGAACQAEAALTEPLSGLLVWLYNHITMTKKVLIFSSTQTLTHPQSGTCGCLTNGCWETKVQDDYSCQTYRNQHFHARGRVFHSRNTDTVQKPRCDDWNSNWGRAFCTLDARW